jgi:hypothetical protein
MLCLLATPALTQAGILGVREAEDTTITCAFSPHLHRELWASGGKQTPARWGYNAGDKLEFEMETPDFAGDVRMALRYAYHKDSHEGQVKDPAPRELNLVIDGTDSVVIPVPDTKGWNHYGVSEVVLPPLQPGKHLFQLVCTADKSCTNVDAFVFFTEPVDRKAEGLLRPVRVVDRTEGIVLCVSDQAVLTEPIEQIDETLQGLFDLMGEDFAVPDGLAIYTHLTDKHRWWNVDGRVVHNRYGIYMLADGNGTDRTEWCWALARYFVKDSGVPGWFADTSSRVTGWMDWLPSLKDSVSDQEAGNAAATMAQAQDLLQSEELTTDRAEVVHMAVRMKYGDDSFRKFWQKIAERRAGSNGTPGSYDKHGVVAVLSEAVGEDVLPLYKRWTGFADEGPVDPLLVRVEDNR